jgi:D-sedoheptulose 7-phosphate isomerase
VASKGYVEQLRYVLSSVNETHLTLFTQQLRLADTVYVLGNGGSQANAAHLVLHLRDNGIRAFDVLADNAWASATSNDYSYDEVPRHLPKIRVRDMAFVISGSGDSKNVLALLDAFKGRTRLGLLGNNGGAARRHCTVYYCIPSTEYGVIEDVHSACIHIINELLKEGA